MRGLRCAELFEEQVLRINIDAAAAGNLWVFVRVKHRLSCTCSFLNFPYKCSAEYPTHIFPYLFYLLFQSLMLAYRQWQAFNHFAVSRWKFFN